MKKVLCCILCLLLFISLYACAPAPASLEEAAKALASQIPSLAPLATPAAIETPAATETPAVTETLAPTETPAPSPTPAGPKMYSSYAYLVSFDPDTGVAQFDYFDILRGAEAVEYLVEHDGVSQAEAQARVDDFADSEFVEKNSSNALRAIDIDDVPLKLMYQPNGNHVPDVESVPSSAGDFRKIYKVDSSRLLDSYFFYIHVDSGGHVSLVEQVYWA